MATVTLWHPTTQSLATCILHESLHRCDESSAIADVARAFGVDVEPVRRLLRQWRRPSPWSSDGRRAALLTPDRYAAVCLAQQEPRMRSDTLWAVWCVHNGISDGRPPLSEPEASAWHVDQLFPDAPAVVEVNVAEDDVRIEQRPAATIGWSGSATGSETVQVACVGLPVDTDQVVARYTMPRWIGVPAAAGMTGRSVGQLRALVERGDLVPPRDPVSPLGDPYWTIGEIFDLLDGA